MNANAFDAFTRRTAAAVSRRKSLLTIGGAALGATVAAPFVVEADLKKKECKKKCKKKCQCKPKPPQADCAKSDDCCPDKTKYTCGTSHGSGSNTCCGTQDAVCGSTLDCCIDQCCINSTCVPGPCP